MATPEYIEKVTNQAIPYESPKPLQSPKAPQLPQPSKKTKILTRKEIMMASVISALAFLLIFSNLITQVVLSNQNRDLQDLQTNNAQVAADNTNLGQEVQELSRYNRIMEIAEELGLEMDEANVRNVSR